MAQKNRYIKWGLTVFCVVAAILLFYDTLFGHQVLQKFIRQFSGAVRPVLYGAFMAYLLVPVVDFFERQFCSVSSVKKAVQTGKAAMAVRALSILLTWVVIGVLLTYAGSVGMLSVVMVLMYQAAWSALSLAVCALKQHNG